MTDTLIRIFEDKVKYDHFKSVGCTPLMLIFGKDLQTDIQTFYKHQKTVIFMNKAPTGRKNEITFEMKQAAKEYPFTNLHQFKYGKCVCPFHADNDPSMKLYPDNTVHCFSCNKSWDTIAFVMDLEGLSYYEAIKRLQ